jgi:hypothetical protein
MTDKTKAAWHRCNDNHAMSQIRLHFGQCKQSIPRAYAKGVLIAGILIAVSFGLMFIHAAVAL